MATATKPMSMREAAEKLLRDNGGPMKVADLTDRAIGKGMIKTAGKTPAATMGSVLGTESKKADPTFIRTSPGTFGLRGRDRKGQKAKNA